MCGFLFCGGVGGRGPGVGGGDGGCACVGMSMLFFFLSLLFLLLFFRLFVGFIFVRCVFVYNRNDCVNGGGSDFI